jgi:hypothetical protein
LIDEDPNETSPVQSSGVENLGASAVLTVLQGLGAANAFNGSQLALVRFDLPPVPEYLIDKATLHLYHTGGNGQDVAVHRMKTGWSEEEATFLTPAVDAPPWEAGWASGENYEIQPTDVVQVSDPDRWYDWDVTEDVKAFLDGTPNHGWVVMAGDTASEPDVAGTMFAAREAGEGVRGYVRITMKGANSASIKPGDGEDEQSISIVRFGAAPHQDIIFEAANKTQFPEKEVARDNAMKPDDDPPIKHQLDHYYNPDGLGGLGSGNAPQCAEDYARFSKMLYQRKDMVKSGEILGYASHYPVDVSNPLHTGREADQITNQFPHNQYETWVAENWYAGSSYYYVTTNDLYFYRVRSPFETTKNIARYSHGFTDYVYTAFCSQRCEVDVEGNLICLYDRPWEQIEQVDMTLRSLTRNNMLVASRNIVGLVKYVQT